ncbi:3-dehydroquinate synthase family protein [Stigmatella aurantiaca]|uniref:2-epi-valiolone synthase n=1 Tax=Stigmatella aurantiaca (strain DW4/3-1) TaxID=378806 RepID=EVS_STIAD|nr:3-dehydroquinate synthase family protein [Stigmatella aurantiaca]Q08VU0.1 RecName: Full=2-epi-valiolone synthase; Short=EVS; AltName: Full=Sedoheptulose 7-phosphate cyclase [Stigmatella aurantiaca DW4/3-1]ADO70932.1 3-dehydroquinate synthase [Stigmatella aurantiaca DW4/3-1]EAU64596.1 3-dehydroquinate synthase [Stigmatella aurantiaca DW4/3-1]
MPSTGSTPILAHDVKSPHRGSLALDGGKTGYRVTVHREDRYEIIIGRGTLARLGELLRPVMAANEADSAVIITDNHVGPLYAELVTKRISATGAPVQCIVIPAGEPSKSIAQAHRLWDELRSRSVRRRTFLVALGGGVLCDLVGFVATTYLRGIPYVNVATSLMGQVDGAIGGKVGVDHSTGKNLIGGFYHPDLVVIDPSCLATLPLAEVINGLAEAVKVALIGTPGLFEQLERLPMSTAWPLDQAAPERLIEGLGPIIPAAIGKKLELLAPDPFEQDLRRLLNLGHSVGHGLEAATHFVRYRHGEAVAIGTATVTAISTGLGLTSVDTLRRILRLLQKLRLPVTVPDDLREVVWQHLETARLVRNGRLLLVMPTAIDHSVIIDDITRGQYDAACQLVAQEAPACG